MADWNGLDFIILIIFIINTVLGMSRGAMRELISALCLSAGLIIMIRFTVPLANFFNSSPLINNMVDNRVTENFMLAIGAGPLTADFLMQIFYSISLLICFVGTFTICEAGMTKTGFVEAYSFPFAAWNRHVGGILGFVRGYVINLILLLILILHIFKDPNSGLINPGFFNNSYFAKLYRNATIHMDAIITGQNPDRYQEIFKDKNLYTPEMLKKQLDSGVQVPSPPSQPKPNETNNVNGAAEPSASNSFVMPQQP